MIVPPVAEMIINYKIHIANPILLFTNAAGTQI